MPRLTLLLVAAAALIAACGCGGINVVDAGPHVVRTRPVAAFQRIEVHGSTNVIVHRGGNARTLTVSGGKERVADVRTRVEGGTLIVTRHDESATVDLGDADVTVRVSAPSLAGVRVDGSGDVLLPELAGGPLDIQLNGSADVRGAGQLDDLDAGVDGSGSLDMGDVIARDATVDISGSGDADVHAERTLEARVHGSGDVHYRGDPKLTREVEGSGSVSPGS